jgi:hypothetical protein
MKKFMIAAALLFAAAAGSIFAQNIGNLVVLTTCDSAHGGGRIRWSQCAFTPDGVLHVVYGTANSNAPVENAVWYIKYDGTTTTAPVDLTNPTPSLTINPTGYGFRPTISTNSQGKICVAWGVSTSRTGEVKLRIFDPAIGTWGPIELVDPVTEGGQGDGYYEPYTVLDSEGNIYIVFYNENGAGWMTNAKIDGVWEGNRRLGDGTGKQGYIIASPNGTIWTAWRQKDAYGYYGLYSTRTKTTGWASPTWVRLDGEPAHPCLAVGADNHPFLAVGEEAGAGEEIGILKLLTNHAEASPVQIIMQHYPRIVVDANGNLHLAIQRGGGDYGDGIEYTNNIGLNATDWNNWKDVQYLPAALPKLPGLAADPFGNVAISYTSLNTDAGSADVIINSLKPIQPMYFEPPVDLGISISMTGLRKSPGITYNLTWAANPKNDDRFLMGYKIYMKVGDGAWTAMTEVSPATKSASFTFQDATQRRLFSIDTVSIGGMEGQTVVFGQ